MSMVTPLVWCLLLLQFVGYAAAFGQLAVIRDVGCVVWSNGALHCWGKDTGRVVQLIKGSKHPAHRQVVRSVHVADNIICILLPAAPSEAAADGEPPQSATGGGSAYCWGDATVNFDANQRPVSLWAPDVKDKFTHIAVRRDAFCGILVGGRVKCLGHHRQPAALKGPRWVVSAPPADHRFLQIAMAGQNWCGIDAGTRGIVCWGYRSRLENGISIDPVRFQTRLEANGTRFYSMAVNAANVCALTFSGALWCSAASIGEESSIVDPALGITVTVKSYPVLSRVHVHHSAEAASAADGAESISFASVAAGYGIVCGIEARTHAAVCFRPSSGFGNLRPSVPSEVSTTVVPDLAPPIGQSFVQLALSDDRRMCGVTVPPARVVCWTTKQFVLEEIEVPAEYPEVVDVSITSDRVCVIGESNSVSCWAYQQQGKMSHASKVPINGMFIKVQHSNKLRCALSPIGAVSVQRIDGTAGPVPVLPTGYYIDVAVNENVVCGVTYDGYTHCRAAAGDERAYQVISKVPPRQIQDIFHAVRIVMSPDGDDACVLQKAGIIECWGLDGRLKPPFLGANRPERYTNVFAGPQYDGPCAQRNDGIIICTPDLLSATPTREVEGGASVVQFSIDRTTGFGCGVTKDGAPKCFPFRLMGSQGIRERLPTGVPLDSIWVRSHSGSTSGSLACANVRLSAIGGLAVDSRFVCWSAKLPVRRAPSRVWVSPRYSAADGSRVVPCRNNTVALFPGAVSPLCSGVCALGEQTGVSGGHCVGCPPGSRCASTYAEMETGIGSIPCAAGRQQPSPNQVQCVECPSGRASALPGTVACEPCLGGLSTKSRSGSTKCVPCDAGTVGVRDATGDVVCTPCPEGSASGETGATECAPCVGGSVANRLRTGCECPAGRYSIQSARDAWRFLAAAHDGLTAQEEALQRRNATWCRDCPDGAQCAVGASMDTLRPIPGFWYDRQRTAVAFYLCPVPERCDVAAHGGKCPSGYDDPLCAACSAGFSRAGDSCVECANPSRDIAIGLGFIAVQMSIIAVTTFLSIRAVRQGDADGARPDGRDSLTEAKPPRHEEAAEGGDGNEKLEGVFLKVFINTLQFSGVALSVFIKWPAFAEKFFAWITSALNIVSGAWSIGCFGQALGVTASHVVFGSISAAVSPFAFALGTSAYCALRFQYQKRRLIGDLSFRNGDAFASAVQMRVRVAKLTAVAWRLFESTLLCGLFFLHGNLAAWILRLTVCVDVAGGGSRVLGVDYGFECHTPEHRLLVYGVGAGVLLPLVIGIPLAAVLRMRSRRAHLLEVDNQVRYAFLFGGYKLDYYYWELVVLARKAALILVVSTVDDVQTQLSAGTGIVLIAYALQSAHRPFNSDAVNLFERVSLMSSFGIFYAGALFQSADAEADTATRVIRWLASAGVVTAMTMYLLFFIVVECVLIDFFWKWAAAEGWAARTRSRAKRFVMGGGRASAVPALCEPLLLNSLPPSACGDEHDGDAAGARGAGLLRVLPRHHDTATSLCEPVNDGFASPLLGMSVASYKIGKIAHMAGSRAAARAAATTAADPADGDAGAAADEAGVEGLGSGENS